MGLFLAGLLAASQASAIDEKDEGGPWPIDVEAAPRPEAWAYAVDETIVIDGFLNEKAWKEAAPITGLLLAKLDGTARGGIVVTLKEEFGIPIKLVGTGEQLEDLEDFDAGDFARSLLG